jgi:cyclopropane fatty-acyl-phospholipid synthase-like methyltransferase
MSAPRLYNDLSWIWSFLSPPESYAAEAASFLKRFRDAGVPDGGTLLHLGSGGGSLDAHLKKNYRVTGIELSQNMIRWAHSINVEVEYVQGDMRSARLGRRFDAVLVHDAIAYMLTSADLKAAYATAAAHLKPGGVMISLPEEVRTFFKQHKVTHRTVERDGKSVTTVTVAYDADPKDETFETTYVYLIRENGRLTIETDTHTMGIRPLGSFLEAIREAGLEASVEAWDIPDVPEGFPLITAVMRQ